MAEKLGMTVGFMRRNVSGQEYGEWSTYYRRKAQAQELEMKRSRG